MNCCRCLFLLLIPLQGMGQGNFLRFLPEESALIRTADCQSMHLRFLIEEGFYIQANEVLNENFIPTQIQLDNKLPIEVQKVLFPKAEIILLGGIERTAVFQGKMDIWIEFEPDSWPVQATDQMKGALLYQACNKLKCFFPRKLSFELLPSKRPKILMP